MRVEERQARPPSPAIGFPARIAMGSMVTKSPANAREKKPRRHRSEDRSRHEIREPMARHRDAEDPRCLQPSGSGPHGGGRSNQPEGGVAGRVGISSSRGAVSDRTHSQGDAADREQSPQDESPVHLRTFTGGIFNCRRGRLTSPRTEHQPAGLGASGRLTMGGGAGRVSDRRTAGPDSTRLPCPCREALRSHQLHRHRTHCARLRSVNWSELVLATPVLYRFIKYQAPNGSWGNVAEGEFNAGDQQIRGTPFGTTGSRDNAGRDFSKAVDGDVSTFFMRTWPINSTTWQPVARKRSGSWANCWRRSAIRGEQRNLERTDLCPARRPGFARAPGEPNRWARGFHAAGSR